MLEDIYRHCFALFSITAPADREGRRVLEDLSTVSYRFHTTLLRSSIASEIKTCVIISSVFDDLAQRQSPSHILRHKLCRGTDQELIRL